MDTVLKVLALGLLVSMVSVCCAQDHVFYSCAWIMDSRIDCSLYNEVNHTGYCGSDGATYGNKCYFSQKHCNMTSLNLAHEGRCGAPIGATPANHISGSSVAQDFFCVGLSHHHCRNDVSEPICGDDGFTYYNFCEFEKQKCTHRHLQQVMFGTCI